MILHMGDQELVNTKDLVAILSYECLMATRAGVQFLKEARTQGTLREIGKGRQGSVMLLADGTAIVSPISAGTMQRRLTEGRFIDPTTWKSSSEVKDEQI